MTLRDLQPEPLELLDAAQARACEVVDPELLDLVRDRIAMTLAGTAPERAIDGDRELAVAAVIDQMLVDVASLDDATVQRADALLPPGGLADLVMASYVMEARMRLTLAADRLLGGLE